MLDLKGLRITGILAAAFATAVAMGSEGFYIWKTVEASDCLDRSDNSTGNSSDIWEYEPCFDSRNDSDVCYHSELEMRSYIGVAEGAVGWIAGIALIVGFARIMLPVIWVWVVWALGITAYNSYCIYDYFTTIKDNTVDCIDDSEFWDFFTDQDYAHFFIMCTTAVCGYGVALCIIIPVTAVLTNMVGPNSPTMGSYELQARKDG